MFLVAMILGFLLSKFLPILYKDDSDSVGQVESNVSENLITINNKQGQTRNTIVMQTASLDEKVLPTTKLYLEKKYEDCKHTVKAEVELPPEMINLTRDELSKLYKDWIIREFSESKIVLYKIAEGICDEHFIITDEDGLIVVYRLDEEYNKHLYEKTDISTEYLPIEDMNRLKEGIYVYTLSNLNSELENFE